MNRREMLTSVSRYHVVYRILGLTPFSVDRRTLRLGRSHGTIAHATAVLVLCLTATGYLVYVRYILPTAVKFTLNFIWHKSLTVLLCTAAVTSVTVDTFQNTRRFQRILSLLWYRDTNLLKFRRSSETSMNIVCWLFLAVTLTRLACLILLCILLKRNALVSAALVLIHTVNLATILRYVVLVLLVKSDVRSLNRCLKWRQPRSEQELPLASRYRMLRRVYGALCEVSQEVLLAHEASLALLTSTLILTVSWHVACLLQYFHQGRSMFSESLFLVYNALLLVMILMSSHALYREAALTAPAVLRRLLDVSTWSPEAVELRRLWRLADSCRPAHCLFGILPLDLSLLLVLVSACTTYTVILITF